MSTGENARSTSFWQFDQRLARRLNEEPYSSHNRQIMPIERYCTHPVSSCEVDYSRAILSLPLRGLQGKTQVFPTDREFFVRSRLTHTLEVAVNATTIFDEIIARGNRAIDEGSEQDQSKAFLLDDEIQMMRYALMTACLLHDVGNPPFGHFGEEAIRDWFKGRRSRTQDDSSTGANGDSPANTESESPANMEDNLSSDTEDYDRDLCYFEGNANSLRIALRGTRLFDGRRMNPTLLTLCALIKYPWDSAEALKKDPEKVKYNYFISDAKMISALCDQCGDVVKISDGERSRLSRVMEAADDISYVTSDFEDAFRKGKFTVDEVLTYLMDRWLSERDNALFSSNSTKANAFTLLYLLAFIAGDEQTFSWITNIINEKQLDNQTENLIAWKGKIGPNYAEWLLDAQDTNKGVNQHTQHTFRSSLQDYSECELDATQKRQIQETYVGRWVDIARNWLCYSAACSLSKEDTMHKGDVPLFASHYMTVELLKKVLKHFVYDAPDNAKMNARAETVLKGLLDKFIPAVEECVRNNEDDEHTPVCPKGLSSTTRALLTLIPMRYRLDYEAAYQSSSPRWDVNRQKYELDMMALDFISSLPDDYAIQLYSELYKAV